MHIYVTILHLTRLDWPNFIYLNLKIDLKMIKQLKNLKSVLRILGQRCNYNNAISQGQLTLCLVRQKIKGKKVTMKKRIENTFFPYLVKNRKQDKTKCVKNVVGSNKKFSLQIWVEKRWKSEIISNRKYLPLSFETLFLYQMFSL